jgi:hypothetical protein
MIDYALAVALAFWMLAGGDLFAHWPPASLAFLLTLAGLVGWHVYRVYRLKRLKNNPPLREPLTWLFIASILSLVANANPQWIIRTEFSLQVILALFAGLEVMILAYDLGRDRLLNILYLAGWAWLPPFVLLNVLGVQDNRNLAAIWPLVMMIVLLERRKPWWLGIPYLAVSFFLGSRSGLVGLGVALLIYLWPLLDLRKLMWADGVLAVATLAALVLVRPLNAANRLYYWRRALTVGMQTPWFGLGPGGIQSRMVIEEPGASRFVPHAHNLLVQVFAEYGLIGLLALLAGGVWVWRFRGRLDYDRWQLALLAGFGAICLVDFPLYFFGPLLVCLAIAGTVRARA